MSGFLSGLHLCVPCVSYKRNTQGGSRWGLWSRSYVRRFQLGKGDPCACVWLYTVPVMCCHVLSDFSLGMVPCGVEGVMC